MEQQMLKCPINSKLVGPTTELVLRIQHYKSLEPFVKLESFRCLNFETTAAHAQFPKNTRFRFNFIIVHAPKKLQLF